MQKVVANTGSLISNPAIPQSTPIVTNFVIEYQLLGLRTTVSTYLQGLVQYSTHPVGLTIIYPVILNHTPSANLQILPTCFTCTKLRVVLMSLKLVHYRLLDATT